MRIKTLLLTLIILVTGCTTPTKKAFRHQTSTPTKTEAILKLDTKGHTARINDIIVTKSGDIISVSEDKTIRVWDSKTGKEKRKILGQIGAGDEGKIYAIAFSPNEEFLAVGGFLGKKENLIEIGKIRIYNYQSGRLIKVLKSHTVVNDLSFSSDGKYLISGSGDFTAKIWNSERDFRLVDTISFHNNGIYAVKIIKSRSDYFAVTAGFDNKIALYNMQTKEIVNSHKLPYKLMNLAISKKHIAVCGTEAKKIQIYNYNLNLITTINSKTKPKGLAYSPNGELLIAGTGGYPLNINIYSVNQNYKKIQSFTKHKNLTMAVAFLDNQTAVSGGGDNFEMYIWNIKRVNGFKKIEGVGDTVWSIGVKGDTIAWGNEHLSNQQVKNYTGKLQKSINLKTFQISEHGVKSMFHRVSTSYKNYQLLHRRVGDYGYFDRVLDIKRDGKREASIVRDATNGVRHNCYGFYKNYIVSGGMNGDLKIYNLKGKEVANLVGHTGEVFSIAIDGDRLVSGSSDQTIRVWDLSKLKMKSEKLKINEIVLADAIKILDLPREQVLKKAKTNNQSYNQIYIAPQMQPQLSLFISKNNEWIAWTPQGFYNASKGAEKYIGYHINQGSNKEAKFLDITRFRKQFYRPYLISKAIEGEDISSYAKGIDIDSLLSAGLPPKVKILNSDITTDEEMVDIGVDVCMDSGGSANEHFYIDGKAIPSMDSTKGFRFKEVKNRVCEFRTRQISIPSGTHSLGFDTTNEEGNILSNRSTITVTSTKKVTKKPNLHVLTLSVNDYKDDGIKDLEFPNNDAKEVIEKLESIGKPVFRNIYTYSLKDNEVTQSHIDAKVAQIAKKVETNDVFVLYISGHGVTNKSDENYYFIPYDCPEPSKADLPRQGISHDNFKNIMSQINTNKSAILLDTCQSGGVAEKLVKSTIQRLGLDVGLAIIAGASSTQDAIDGYKKHGVFTYTVLDAMNKTQHYGEDKELSINEIAGHVKYVLPKLAKEKFHHKQEATIYMQGDTTFSVGGL